MRLLEENSYSSLVRVNALENHMDTSAAEREEKQFDYFVLLRNPTSPDKAITGSYLIDANGILASEVAVGGDAILALVRTTDGRTGGRKGR